MKLEIGMIVKLKEEYSGTKGTITYICPYTKGKRVFKLDYKDSEWLAEDFEYCVDYPNLSMEQVTIIV